MRKLAIALALVFMLLASSATVMGADNKNKYPTITVIFSDGKVYDINGKMWATTIIPYIEGRIKDYKWEQNPDMAQYIFFDKALKGLNPYGLDFIKVVEKSTYEQFKHNVFIPLSRALNETAKLDSDHDGYANLVELNNGTLPGFADSHPGMNEKTFWEKYGGYIVIGVLMLSVFVLYFVFNKESEKEKI